MTVFVLILHVHANYHIKRYHHQHLCFHILTRKNWFRDKLQTHKAWTRIGKLKIDHEKYLLLSSYEEVFLLNTFCGSTFDTCISASQHNHLPPLYPLSPIATGLTILVVAPPLQPLMVLRPSLFLALSTYISVLSPPDKISPLRPFHHWKLPPLIDIVLYPIPI